MSKSLATKNVAAVALGLALIVTFTFALATPAKAQTIADLQAQIQALLAQIAALQGGGSVSAGAGCYTFTRNHSMGESGGEVMWIQKFLNAHGALVASVGAGSPGNETSYFGARTKAAVSAFQAANGISPTAGFWGPITRAKANALCAAAPAPAPAPAPGTPAPAPTPTPAGPLQGGAGSITDVDYDSALSNEEVGEGADDVKVAGFDIEADDGSDIELTAVNLNFSDTGTTNNEPDLDDYASEVSVWFDGKEVARVDADEFDSDNAYNKTLTLSAGAIIRSGDTKKLTVAVSGGSNIDSASAGDSWSLELESIRFRDAQASVITDSDTGVINDGSGRTFTFETFATASDVEFKVAADDDAVNNPHVIDVHASNKTTNVKLASFTLEAVGDSDLKIEDFHASTTVTGAAHVDDILSGGTAPAIRLVIDGTSYGTAAYANDSDGASVGTDEGIHFDEVNFTLAAGDKVDAHIEADLLSTGDNLDVGDTIQVDVGENETDRGALFRVEDETGEALADADKTGTVTGGPHAVYD
ncbi:peptidoglycan-binding protein, partial [Candidatus Kaiserbacteria bacterium]|nr:peptidoglycan-binding protein [Candidatus Kaiserbacteria bacterium]